MNSQKFEEDMVKYLISEGYDNPKIKGILPKYTLYEMDNGKRRMVSGEAEAQKANQLVLSEHLITLLYHANHYNPVTHKKSFDYVNDHLKQFDELLEIVNQFSEKFIVAPKRIEEINKLYEMKNDKMIEEIVESFVALMTFTRRGAPADFKFFGKTIGRNRYKSLSEIWDATIIHQSITGLYETRMKLED